MTVYELRCLLSDYNDDTEIELSCNNIHGAKINSNITLYADDFDENSPLYLRFSLDKEVCSSGY